MRIGEKFGRLTTMSNTFRKEVVSKKHKTREYVICECDCGNKKECRTDQLKNGRTRSCGCLQKENVTKADTTHGCSKRGTDKYRSYSSWQHMKARCLNPNNKYYKNYGGRGIKICDEWLKFENFYADMGDRDAGYSIERIDNDGDYKKENCKWASFKEQMNNTRRNKKH